MLKEVQQAMKKFKKEEDVVMNFLTLTKVFPKLQFDLTFIVLSDLQQRQVLLYNTVFNEGKYWTSHCYEHDELFTHNRDLFYLSASQLNTFFSQADYSIVQDTEDKSKFYLKLVQPTAFGYLRPIVLSFYENRKYSYSKMSCSTI